MTPSLLATAPRVCRVDVYGILPAASAFWKAIRFLADSSGIVTTEYTRPCAKHAAADDDGRRARTAACDGAEQARQGLSSLGAKGFQDAMRP